MGKTILDFSKESVFVPTYDDSKNRSFVGGSRKHTILNFLESSSPIQTLIFRVVMSRNKIEVWGPRFCSSVRRVALFSAFPNTRGAPAATRWLTIRLLKPDFCSDLRDFFPAHKTGLQIFKKSLFETRFRTRIFWFFARGTLKLEALVPRWFRRVPSASANKGPRFQRVPLHGL